MDNIPIKNIEHIFKQYEQMHCSKREWEKYIWQSPFIIVSIIAASLALATTSSVRFFEGHFIISLCEILLGFLCLVIALWAHRSRVLLRIIEKKLIQLEEKYFIAVIPKYPINLNKDIKSTFGKLSSTKLVVAFLFFISCLVFLSGIIELYLWILRIACYNFDRNILHNFL